MSFQFSAHEFIISYVIINSRALNWNTLLKWNITVEYIKLKLKVSILLILADILFINILAYYMNTYTMGLKIEYI